MKYAVIDIGSNTIRLCIYQAEGHVLSLLLNQCVMARLGSKAKDGVLTREGIDAACRALEDLKKPLREANVKRVFVFATAALRNIANTKEAANEIRERTGFTLDVLSGEQEAMLTFLGATQSQHIRDGLIADIGGGSTELVLVENGRLALVMSLPIGSLTAFVRFVKQRPATCEQVSQIRAFVASMLETQCKEKKAAQVLYGIGGAARTAAELEKILYPASGGAILVLETLLSRLVKDDKLAEESILKASPERLDTALPGVAILCEIARYFDCKRLDICKAGVREGYLMRQISELEKEGS